jgi:hypothetical protein
MLTNSHQHKTTGSPPPDPKHRENADKAAAIARTKAHAASAPTHTTTLDSTEAYPYTRLLT